MSTVRPATKPVVANQPLSDPTAKLAAIIDPIIQKHLQPTTAAIERLQVQCVTLSTQLELLGQRVTERPPARQDTTSGAILQLTKQMDNLVREMASLRTESRYTIVRPVAQQEDFNAFDRDADPATPPGGD